MIKNWKPLRLERIADSPLLTVGDILGELTTVATLRIQIVKWVSKHKRLYSWLEKFVNFFCSHPKYHFSCCRSRHSAVLDIKDKLLRLLLLQSHNLLLSSGCPLDEVSSEFWKTNSVLSVFFKLELLLRACYIFKTDFPSDEMFFFPFSHVQHPLHSGLTQMPSFVRQVDWRQWKNRPKRFRFMRSRFETGFRHLVLCEAGWKICIVLYCLFMRTCVIALKKLCPLSAGRVLENTQFAQYAHLLDAIFVVETYFGNCYYISVQALIYKSSYNINIHIFCHKKLLFSRI